MATLQEHIREIQTRTHDLLGKKAWGVTIGHGSFLTMEFGQPLAPKRVGDSVHGEWYLWLYGCGWRLEQEGVVLVASEDRRVKMETEVQRLEGCALESLELLTPALDAVFRFEGNKLIRTFDLRTEEMESWMIFTPDKVIQVGPAGNYFYSE